MKIATAQHKADQITCSLPTVDNTFFEKLFDRKTFNVPAVRARAGILNFLLGITLVFHLTFPGSVAELYLSVFLLFDMLVAVAFGLTPLSPTGVLGTWLALKARPVPTPHLPKRFAWSMGASMSLIIVALFLMSSADIWITLVLAVFFALTWLDAVLGFCLGCWIYSKLFGCQSCSVD